VAERSGQQGKGGRTSNGGAGFSKNGVWGKDRGIMETPGRRRERALSGDERAASEGGLEEEKGTNLQKWT